MSLVICRQVVVLVMWLPQVGKYSFVSGNMIDRGLLL